MNSTDQTHGSTVQFWCRDGYQLIGASRASCDDGKWTETLSRCLAICRSILSIESGQVIGNGNVEGDQVRFVCDRNYVLVGEEFLRCTNTGNWSASKPICKETCSDPNENTNARVIGDKFHDGKQVEFVCPQDQILVPEASRKLTCQRGEWNGVFPSCKASCPSLGRIINGVKNGTDKTYGSVVQFTCLDGYKLIGASEARCVDGEWTETLPQCLGTCSDPNESTNARVTENEFYNGKQVEFVCPQDHILVPEASRKLTCQRGKWNGVFPTCKASCPSLGRIVNGVISGTDKTHGSAVQFACLDGYELIGASKARCVDGGWTENLPQCLAICGRILSFENGLVIGGGNLEGDQIRFACDETYVLVGEEILKCTSSGTWNASEPICEETCSDPNEETNARVVGTEFFDGKEVEFVCPPDVSLVPEASRKLTCENGVWNGEIPTCRTSCEELLLPNGLIQGDREHGFSVQFICNGGYQLIGASTATCNNGRWSEEIPSCLATCSKISSIANGRVIGKGTVEGDEIAFVCDPNFIIVGEKVLKCTNAGSWNASYPKCERSCPDPSKDTNAKVIGSRFYNGEEVEFECPVDGVLTPEKSRKLTCKRGSWSGIIPSCKASCPPLKRIPTNGYANNTESRSHGSSIQFGCNNGYKLIGPASINCYEGKWSNMPPKCLAGERFSTLEKSIDEYIIDQKNKNTRAKTDRVVKMLVEFLRQRDELSEIPKNCKSKN
ncbi:CUB and sushi domain-containing protein 3-like [Dendronephthya gigantea]|uniref:CUB and sushi domain-containing protein 3-like n=1 Tax=Dendronephthya gigantea TaxID=151771 RepID=UPI00106BA7D4|nr:CUB and sushi domain-containing protein 3-like [Dendronephthya gigantea]